MSVSSSSILIGGIRQNGLDQFFFLALRVKRKVKARRILNQLVLVHRLQLTFTKDGRRFFGRRFNRKLLFNRQILFGLRLLLNFLFAFFLRFFLAFDLFFCDCFGFRGLP